MHCVIVRGAGPSFCAGYDIGGFDTAHKLAILTSLAFGTRIDAEGIHVEGINFFTGFCVEGHTHAIRRQDRENGAPMAQRRGL